jgi:hypothetical protein
MKSQIRVTHLLVWLSLFAIVGFANQAVTPRITEEERDFKIFSDRVQEYVKLQRSLKASLPTLNPTKESTRIIDHQHALALKIADARRNARQGDIFSPKIAERFRKIIDKTLRGPEGRFARETIRPDRSARVLRMHVNDVYPEDIPMTTTPPTLLSRLPHLPQELAYRIVGRDLTLLDSEARLVLDFIPKVIR